MFTVLEMNSVLGSSHYRGEFETEALALEYATREAGRSREFMSYEIWTGTPRKPGRPTGKGVRLRKNPGGGWDYEGGIPPAEDLDEDAEVLRRSSALERAGDVRHLELVARKIAAGWQEGYPVDGVAASLPEVGTVTWSDLAALVVNRPTARGAVPERYVREVFEAAWLHDNDRYVDNPRRSARRNPAATGYWLVLRVNQDDRDTYAVPVPELAPSRDDLEDSISDALALAIPDDGAVLEYTTIESPDAGAARLLHGRRVNTRWFKVPPGMLTKPTPKDRYAVVNRETGKVLGHVDATWLGTAQSEAESRFGSGAIAYVESPGRTSAVGSTHWSAATRRNPSRSGQYLVLMVNNDVADTYAVRYEGDLEDALAEVLDAALPDPGASLQYGIVSAGDEGDARLMPGQRRVRWAKRWRNYEPTENPSTFREWPANYNAGRRMRGAETWHMVKVARGFAHTRNSLCGKVMREIVEPSTIAGAIRDGINVCDRCAGIFGQRT